MIDDAPAYDGTLGTAGGSHFGHALRDLALGRELEGPAFARASGLTEDYTERVLSGTERVGPAVLARFCQALRLKPIEFMQKTHLLSLDVYAYGLDPLFFLPEGQVRYDARIYMREINPRHAVPERDMIKRNPTLSALMADAVVDDLGRLEVELTYLLRAAIQKTGGRL
jgi:hypothetical protein